MNEQPARSSGQLLISTVSAAVVAALILVTVVLPAEYGMDPLHTGQLLGLSAMSASKGGAAAGNVTPADTNVMHAHPQKYRSARHSRPAHSRVEETRQKQRALH
jgi:hypothetical protein